MNATLCDLFWLCLSSVSVLLFFRLLPVQGSHSRSSGPQIRFGTRFTSDALSYTTLPLLSMLGELTLRNRQATSTRVLEVFLVFLFTCCYFFSTEKDWLSVETYCLSKKNQQYTAFIYLLGSIWWITEMYSGHISEIKHTDVHNWGTQLRCLKA